MGDLKAWMQNAGKRFHEVRNRYTERKALVSTVDPRVLLTQKAIYGLTLGWIGVCIYFYSINSSWTEAKEASAAAAAAANEAAAKKRRLDGT